MEKELLKSALGERAPALGAVTGHLAGLPRASLCLSLKLAHAIRL